MADSPMMLKNPRWLLPEGLALAAAAALVYLGLPVLIGEAARPPGHFPRLADAFLAGRLTIEIPPSAPARLDELIPTGDLRRFHCPYPPLPAVLLMPIVLIAPAVAKVETACRIVSALNVLAFAACLWRLPGRLSLPPPTGSVRVSLTLLFAFGTVCWHNADMGGDWHLAHAVALGAMLLALREWSGGNRSFVVGCFVGLAVLTRPTAALAGLFFALPLIRARAVPQLVKLLAGPAVAVFLLALYNNARFGSPLDFGYDRMLLRGPGGDLMQQYGQFHPHFIPGNVFWFFLALPWPLPEARFPFLGFDPRGLGLFFATPAFLYVFAAFGVHRKTTVAQASRLCLHRQDGDATRKTTGETPVPQDGAATRSSGPALNRPWRCPCIRDAALGVAACLVPLLLYFNTGYAQFGHRFSMDYLPLLMLLVVAGMGSRPGRLWYGLVGASIAIGALGTQLDPITRLPWWLPPLP